ncbi:hypothetical protein [Aquimarina latercula]|uniref:hypothetical protein n=1 Tax=Aquimarina latercula TaxID=987 RepID=UPI0003FBD4A8|nr:hypothetical protein [Aquimarina latercula]
MERENPFKKLGYPPRDVPEDLKEKVMSDVSSAKLLIDMSALFTSNYRNTIQSSFKKNNKSTK